MDNKEFMHLKVLSFVLYLAKVLLFVLFISMMAHLYKKASAFERSSEIMTPDKKHFLNDFSDIKEKVN